MPTAPKKPTFEKELASVERHGGPIIGVDEAGRGPLAGPVVAAAVAFGAAQIRAGLTVEFAHLNDSKVLKEERRKELCQAIVKHFPVGIGVAERAQIDADNILNATLWAMRAAVHNLNLTQAVVLIDGNKAPDLAFRTETVVGGDGRCLSIAAASIVAKVTRDTIMRELARAYPEYGFAQHKGYGTRAHLEAIRRHGICDAHRRSFRPIREMLKRCA